MIFHKEGHAAFHGGTGALGSPYMDWERRSKWVKGWHDAQHHALVSRAVAEGPAPWHQSGPSL